MGKISSGKAKGGGEHFCVLIGGILKKRGFFKKKELAKSILKYYTAKDIYKSNDM